jgi:hypothetical protein
MTTIPLTPPTERELTDEELERVAGGFAVEGPPSSSVGVDKSIQLNSVASSRQTARG